MIITVLSGRGYGHRMGMKSIDDAGALQPSLSRDEHGSLVVKETELARGRWCGAGFVYRRRGPDTTSTPAAICSTCDHLLRADGVPHDAVMV